MTNETNNINNANTTIEVESAKKEIERIKNLEISHSEKIDLIYSIAHSMPDNTKVSHICIDAAIEEANKHGDEVTQWRKETLKSFKEQAEEYVHETRSAIGEESSRTRANEEILLSIRRSSKKIMVTNLIGFLLDPIGIIAVPVCTALRKKEYTQLIMDCTDLFMTTYCAPEETEEEVTE